MGGICMPQCTHEDQRITCVRWLSAATQWIFRIELESKGLAVHNFIHGAISLAQFFIFIVFLFHFALYFCLIFVLLLLILFYSFGTFICEYSEFWLLTPSITICHPMSVLKLFFPTSPLLTSHLIF